LASASTPTGFFRLSTSVLSSGVWIPPMSGTFVVGAGGAPTMSV
jgi:hypothetical protein